MSTRMHRLQLSLREEQATYLAERARREGLSMAEVVRRLLDEEFAAEQTDEAPEAIWHICGLSADEEQLVDDIPVSERPELYLYDPRAATPGATRPPSARRRRRGG
jgi:hypothetical protein